MRQTKVQMVKDIFFAATVGIRTEKNYPSGMYVIDVIAANNNKESIKYLWDKLNDATADTVNATAKKLLDKLVDWTYINTSGVNGFTKTSISFLHAANKFI